MRGNKFGGSASLEFVDFQATAGFAGAEIVNLNSGGWLTTTMSAAAMVSPKSEATSTSGGTDRISYNLEKSNGFCFYSGKITEIGAAAQ